MPPRFAEHGRSSKRLGQVTQALRPILGGVFTALLVILTLFAAVVLGSQEQLLVAGKPAATASLSPTPTSTPTFPARATVVAVEPTALPPTGTAVPAVDSSTPTSTASPTPTPTRCPMPAGWQVYTVKSGDTLYKLAYSRGTSEQALMQANCLTSAVLSAGQRVYVPPLRAPTRCVRPYNWMDYTVKRGDTLTALALYFGTTVDTLMRVNCLRTDLILAGATLWVPYKAPTSVPPTATRTPSRTPTATGSTTPTATGDTPTPTDTGTPTPTGDVPTPTDTSTPTPTDTGAPAPTDTDTPVPTDTDTPLPTDTDTPTKTPKPSHTPRDTDTSTPIPPDTDTPTPGSPLGPSSPPPAAAGHNAGSAGRYAGYFLMAWLVCLAAPVSRWSLQKK